MVTLRCMQQQLGTQGRRSRAVTWLEMCTGASDAAARRSACCCCRWLGASPGPAGVACAGLQGAWVSVLIHVATQHGGAVNASIEALLQNGTAAATVGRALIYYLEAMLLIATSAAAIRHVTPCQIIDVWRSVNVSSCSGRAS